MRILALETTGGLVSVAAVDGVEMVAEIEEPASPGRAERILPVADATRRAAGWVWADIELLVVSLGPGGYSSIRAGLAVGKALALAIGVPTLGVSTLEVLAEAATGRVRVLALVDARHDAAFAQTFERATAISPAALIDLRHVAGSVGPDTAVVGSAALLDRAGIASSERVEAEPRARYGAAAALRRLASGERPVPGIDLRPLYLRQPDARPDAGKPLVARAV